MKEVGDYYELEYFDLLPLIFDIESESEKECVWIEDHKGNRGILAAYDCGLGFSAWMQDPLDRNDGAELSVEEITPILRSGDGYDLEDISSGIRALRSGIDVFGWGKLTGKDGKPLAIIEDK